MSDVEDYQEAVYFGEEDDFGEGGEDFGEDFDEGLQPSTSKAGPKKTRSTKKKDPRKAEMPYLCPETGHMWRTEAREPFEGENTFHPRVQPGTKNCLTSDTSLTIFFKVTVC